MVLDSGNKYKLDAKKTKASTVVGRSLLLVAGMLFDVRRAPAVLLRWREITLKPVTLHGHKGSRAKRK